METTVEMPTLQEQRGGGGKLRKPSSRRPPTTPYARPPQQQRRWLSKLVDPAFRLVSGGANLIFPSIFSRSSQQALPAPDNQQPDDACDNSDSEGQQNTRRDEDDNQLTSTRGECGTSGASGPSSPRCSADVLKKVFDSDGCKQDQRVGLTDNDGLSKIEQLIKGKTFSKDEINRLMEIVHSRAIDLPEVELTNKHLTLTMREGAKHPTVALENPGQLIAVKQDDSIKSLPGTSSPILKSSMLDEVGASPIEIARAFMGTRSSEGAVVPKSTPEKEQSLALDVDEYALKPFVPSPSPKPSVCWPGAKLQDQHGNLTPQSERGRFGLQNFPRTPYSRTIFSKSKSKSKFSHIQGEGSRNRNIPFSPLKQSQTPIYGQPLRTTLDDGHGSAGPIRRFRNKTVADSPSKPSVDFRFPSINASPAGSSQVWEGFSPAVKKNLEPAGTSKSSIFQSVENKLASSKTSVPIVHPHSSQMAKTILDLLERNPPTPKDKSAELKLAALWKKSDSSTVSSAIPNQPSSSLYLGGLDSSRVTDRGDKMGPAQRNEARATTFFRTPQETKNHADGTASDSNLKGNNEGPLRNTLASPFQNQHESAEKTANSGVPNSMKPPSYTFGSKPALRSISINRHGHSSGFTFPVSTTSSSLLAEPPTPSIMPSVSASSSLQPPNEEGSDIPTYSFGLKKSTPDLVFSFPSTSSAPLHGASDIKFSFGSDESRRISFSSVGKDAVCY